MQITKITDLGSEAVLPYVGLNEKQLKRYYEPDFGLFICESEKVIRRALAAGYEAESFFVAEEKLDIAGELAGEDIHIYTAPESVMQKITGYSLTGGMLCAMKRKSTVPLKEILSASNRIVILDDVENPTNVGAIFRSAAALGADAVLLTAGCTDPLYRRAARVSMGTVFALDWAYVEGGFAEEMHREGFSLVALALTDDAISLREIRPGTEKIAVVLGNEDHGISDELLGACDHHVIIPMERGVDSLNVAAASAVAFWKLFY